MQVPGYTYVKQFLIDKSEMHALEKCCTQFVGNIEYVYEYTSMTYKSNGVHIRKAIHRSISSGNNKEIYFFFFGKTQLYSSELSFLRALQSIELFANIAICL